MDPRPPPLSSAEAPGALPALDGVRGLAVLLVIGTHLHLLGIGWIGVQLFFVLSGFLITRLLLADRGRDSLGGYLRRFYVRRSLRIFPAFYLYVVLLALASAALPQMAPIRPELPYVATYTANLYMTTTHEPLASPANWAIAHLWSLCIEEHFYLFWPLLVHALGRDGLRRLALALVLTGPAIRGLSAAAWPHLPWPDLSPNVPRVVYLLTTSHVDAFATGALITLLPSPRAPGRLLLLAFAAAALAYLAGAAVNGWGIGAAGHKMPLTLGYPIHLPRGWQLAWGYSVINLLSAALLLLALHHAGVGRLFMARWLRYVGRISYGMYLLHMPLVLLTVQAIQWLGWPARPSTMLLLAPLYMAVLVGVAGASFRWYESPLLRLKERWAPSPRAPRGVAPQAAAVS